MTVLASIGFGAPVQAQPASTPPAYEPSTEALRLESDRRLLGGILAGWSIASISLGTAALATSEEPFTQHAGIQAIAWGGVDLALAGLALFTSGVAREDDTPIAIADARSTYETVLWVNAALDVAYITTGALLWALGEDDELRGAGMGIVLQGGFLLGYDAFGALWIGR